MSSAAATAKNRDAAREAASRQRDARLVRAARLGDSLCCGGTSDTPAELLYRKGINYADACVLTEKLVADAPPPPAPPPAPNPV